MPRLLTIVATPHAEGQSRTRTLAAAFLARWRETHPGWKEETLDLFAAGLPPVDPAMIGVLFGYERAFPEELVAPRQAALQALVNQFVAADEYLVITPMWNFGLPYPLKHYFDLVIKPGATFGFNAEGPFGMLEGRKAQVVITTGFDYTPSSPKAYMNHLDAHLRTLFGFMGITDVDMVTVPGMQLPDADERLAGGVARLEAGLAA